MHWLKKFLNVFKEKETMLIPNYEVICKTLKIDESRIGEVKTLCKVRYAPFIERYKAVSEGCTVEVVDENGLTKLVPFPVDLIFALHYRESGCDFKGVLHNGEKIVGKGTKTSLVPKGRGPFISWEEAAIDALMMKKNIFPKVWSFAARLEFAEKYNGTGYRRTGGEYTPYVFAATNFSDETGKFYGDGKYSPTAPEKQLGVAAILIELNRV